MLTPLRSPLAGMAPPPHNLATALREHARRTPDRLAVRFLGDGENVSASLSYGQLHERAASLARHLLTQGEPGQRALLLYPSGLDYVVAFFACLYSGVIAVPAYPPEASHPQHLARLDGMVRDAQAAFILSDSGHLDTLRDWLGVTADPETNKLIATDLLPELAGDAELPGMQADGVAFLQYTSGSTSQPKGVRVTHRNLMVNTEAMWGSMGLTAADVTVSWLPLYHDMGLIGSLLQALRWGGTLVLMSPNHFLENPKRWLKAISKFKGNHSGGPDFAFRLCQERTSEQALRELDLSSWRVAFCGSEPIRAQTMADFAVKFAPAGLDARALYCCYGLAEATLFIAGVLPLTGVRSITADVEALQRKQVVDAVSGTRLVSSGIVARDHAVRIVGEQGQVLEDDQIGEILVSGASVADGYWNNAVATQHAFVRLDGDARIWLRTGDLGFLRARHLYISGRAKDMIVLRGQNIYPQDIEIQLEQDVEALRKGRVAAFPVTVDGIEHIGVAAEVGRSSQKSLGADVLIDAVRTSVARSHGEAPLLVLLLHPGMLPKTTSGKLQRSSCLALADAAMFAGFSLFDQRQAVTAVAAADWSQLDPLTCAVATIWQDVLPQAQVQLDGNFFLLGGNSVSAALIAARLDETLAIRIALRSFFEAPVLQDFIALVRAQQVAQTDLPVVPPLLPQALADTARRALSYAQLRMWFLWKLEPLASRYNIASSLRLRGVLDLQRLQQAFAAVIARHDTLRGYFGEEGDAVFYALHAAPAFQLERADLSALAPADRDAAFQSLVATRTAQPFDLEHGPLLRASLVRMHPDEHILLITAHHIVVDGWSVNLLMQELAQFYSANAPMAALPISYADYAQWQQRWMDGGERQRQLGYWRQVLGEGDGQQTGFPWSRHAPAGVQQVDATHAFAIDAGLTAGLRNLAAAHGVTMAMLLLAAFKTLLYRLSGQQDLRIGSTAANRRRRETESLIGFFVNMLVLRTELDGKMPFATFLQQVRSVTLDASEHQDLPFEQLVEALQPERTLSANPLFQIAFNHQLQSELDAAAFSGLQVDKLTWHMQSTQFDLILHTQEAAQAVTASFSYAADLFDADTIARMAGQWLRLLQAIVDHPEQRIGSLPMLAEDERSSLLAQWNPQRQSYAEQACLHELIEAQVVARPDAVALTSEDSDLSYRQLNSRANQLARRLRVLGVGPESLVGVALERGPDMIVSLLAVLKAGGAYLPLDPAYPAQRLAYMLEDAKPVVLITQAGIALDAGATQVLAIDESVFVGDDSNLAKLSTAANLAYCIYTSGSTGQPKGALLTHRHVTRLFQSTQAEYGFNENDVWSLFHSYAFDFSVWEIFGALLHGGRLVIVPYFTSRSPQEFYRLLLKEQVTVLNQTPSAFRQLIPEAITAKDKGNLRLVVFGGEALDVAALRAWFDAFGEQEPALVNMYGITETTVHVTYRPITQQDCESSVSPIGMPLADLSWYVLDEQMQPVAPGVAGELYIGGAGLARGYLHRAALTAERFVPDPYQHATGGRLYRTGDQARWSADGSMQYLGRNDRQIKLRGFRIELGEIETRLKQDARVSDAVVILNESSAGQQLIAYAVPDVAGVRTAAHAMNEQASHSDGLVDEWTDVFNSTYSAGHAAGPGFTGWNNSYDGKPIATAHMQEWLDRTVERIHALAPQRLLEIGCGVGLLLQHLAPACQRYVGTDISAQAIADLQAWIATQPNLQHTELHQLEGSKSGTVVPAAAVDTVVLNSVAQYFPDIDYLAATLESAASALTADGQIFVGDLRHLALQPLFHSAVQLARAGADMPLRHVRERIARAIAQDNELLVDPAFFAAFAATNPALGSVTCMLKRAVFDNELSNYRYDVILSAQHASGAVASSDIEPQPWQRDAMPALQAALQQQPAALRISGVGNRRLARDLAVRHLLASMQEEHATVQMLRERLELLPLSGEDPEAFWALGEQHGYQTQISWTPGVDDGRFDVVFTSLQASVSAPAPANSPSVSAIANGRGRWDSYASDPRVARQLRQLGPALRDSLHASVPAHMVPAQIVVLTQLPLTANGKLDRPALVALASLAQHSDAAGSGDAHYRAPSGPVELQLAAIWRELLGEMRIGADDNFFALGGHSLLATQLVSRIKRDLQVTINLREVFNQPSLTQLAAHIATLLPVTLTTAATGSVHDEVARMLAEVQDMSEHDLLQLLAAEEEK